MTPALVLTVVAAGALGAVARYLVSRAFSRPLSRNPGFPWAVFVVNVVGSAIGGAVLGLAVRGDLSGDLRLVLLTGLCGGLTTFSTWSVETVQLVHSGKARLAALSVGANLVAGIAAAALAFAVARG